MGARASGLSARTETADQFTMKVRNVDRDFNVDYDRLTHYTRVTSSQIASENRP